MFVLLAMGTNLIAQTRDLIVDQSALSQYETDNYLLFDAYNSNSEKKFK